MFCKDFFIAVPAGFDQVIETLQETTKFKSCLVIKDNEIAEPYIEEENNNRKFFGFVDMKDTWEGENSSNCKLLEITYAQKCSPDIRRWVCMKYGDLVKVTDNSAQVQLLVCSCGSKRYKDTLFICHHPSHLREKPNRKRNEQENMHEGVLDVKRIRNEI